MATQTKNTHSAFLAAVSGMCAVFIGLGLARFAYSPLVPAMVNAGWFTTTQAGHLIAINLIGYFLGALFLRFFAKKISPLLLTKLALVVCAIGLFGRSFALGIDWFTCIRFSLGFFGAILMITTPSFVLTAVPIAERNKTSAIIFTGLGLGIFVAGLLVAGFAKGSPHVIWLIFGFVSFVSAILCWLCLPPTSHAVQCPPICAEVDQTLSLGIKYLIAAYMLIAMAFVPHLLFLVDYLTGTRAYPHASASLVYAGLGLGAMLGSLFGNWLARLFGLYLALIVVMAACVVSTLLIFCDSTILISGSCFLMGLLFTAMVMLISTRILELEGAEKHANVWGVMTIGFAIGQVFSTYFVIYVDHVSKHQGASFVFAAIMFFLSLILVYLAKRK